ncbi:MAG TPA: hypothetical protein VNA26_07860 [Chitinophagaceae bacterium]|nr:hypothetical protein [Chitinophagaceae bacterium]
MSVTWKTKNKNTLNDKIKANENEISRINNYMQNFFATEDETRKMELNINALESANRKLEKMIPSNFSPDQIIKITKPNLPETEENFKKNSVGVIKLPFAEGDLTRHAIWKWIINEWQYNGYE